MKNDHLGFTLIELLVVIAIVGILASIGISTYSGALHRARAARAVSDLREIHEAIKLLGVDTGRIPTRANDPYGEPRPVSHCTYNPELFLNSDDAGIVSDNANRYPNWQGPYMEDIPADPWGTNYYYDPDYRCYVTTQGCEDVADNHVVRAILSAGPNGSFSYGDPANLANDPTDNIVRVLCD